MTAPRREPSLRPDDEGALIARAVDGDRDAFERLYRRHVARVYATVTRLVGPVPEREDLVQEVFLRLHRALPGFRGDARLTTLLHRIAATVAIDHLRRWRRRPHPSLGPDALAELIDPAVPADERVRRAQALAQVFAALDRLKPAKRVALLLRLADDLSFEEIGAAVDASADTAKKRVQHGLRELRAIFARRRAP